MTSTRQEEKENNINFQDITALKENNLSFDIYRKPTTTATIIPNDSCHPKEHEFAAIRYLAKRMETYK